ncbi:MAG: RNA polymerase subunit sigma-70 [Deltaproteobacteria bacterium]|nr:RNA polymerase subunit sigma-70 [Deltaproteobacteria bacterium]
MTDDELTAHFEAQRRALRTHCYRMTGSADDAEELVQETLLRAWRARDSFDGRAKVSTWLYRIATNVCLDVLDKRPARVLPMDVVRAVAPDDEPRATPPLAPELPWLQPMPDALLDPETVTARRETVGLAFLAALQHLPVRQRAILLLCDVVGWSAKETAELLELTVGAVTSTLQRAHETLRVPVPIAPPTDEQRALLARYISAWEAGDASALTTMLRDDVRWAMPPAKLWFVGRAMIEQLLANYPMRFHGDHKLVALAANGQLAAADYMRPRGATDYRLTGVHVLGVAGEKISEITTFGAGLCARFELPMIFSPGAV